MDLLGGPTMKKIKVTVWNEYHHEVTNEKIAAIYPQGIHGCLEEFLSEAGMEVTTATLAMEEHGLSQQVLDTTDVLIWWGHLRHDDVADEIVQRVYQRVQQGMGLIALHSAHASKIFKKLCGTSSEKLKWRVADEKEVLWTVAPGHPIVEGLEEKIILPQEEMYGEFFHIPTPEELIFISWFEGGEVFRSGFTLQRGQGKVFYFRPGHEEYPTFLIPEVQQVIINAVRWAAPTGVKEITSGNVTPTIE